MRKPKRIIKRKEAKEVFQILVDELESTGSLDDKTMLLVDNIVLLEQLKHEHYDDIKERGVVELFKNGAQEMYRENKSVDKIIKLVEQQRKLMNELRLTPASIKKVVSGGDGDDFEDF